MPNDRESRRIAQEKMVSAMARHTSYLNRVATAGANRANRIIDKLAGQLVSELAERLDSLTPAELKAFSQGRYTTSRLKGLRNTINRWAEDLAKELDTEVLGSLDELAGNEAEFAKKLLEAVVTNPVGTGVTAATAAAAARRQPILGELVEDMVADIPDRARRQVFSRIRQGIAQGETTSQITRALRGTKALRYRDGLIQTSRVAAERVVRTATNHVANAAYEETYQALGVQVLVWTATLDGRTSKICASRDGQRYPIGSNHPRPPAHPNCRSVLVPSLDDSIMGERPYVRAFEPISKVPKDQRTKGMVGTVSANTNYGQWFSRQSAAFQREWLGPARYKLYKQGGYKIDRFVDPTGKQYTLAQLRQKDTETFKEIFG